MSKNLPSILILLTSLGYAQVAWSSSPQNETSQVQRAAGLEGYWSDLAQVDAHRAFRAILALTMTPKESVSFLQEKLKTFPGPDTKRTKQLITDLVSGSAGAHEKATLELTKLGSLALPALRIAQQAKPSPEARQRIQSLLAQFAGPVTNSEYLRVLRTLEVLERIGSPEAAAALKKYAAGFPEDPLTEVAKEAAERLSKFERVPVSSPAPRVDVYGDPLPEGAVGRLGTVRFRREDDLVFEPPGFCFLPGDKALLQFRVHNVRIWDIPSGRVLKDIDLPGFYITAFALANEGREFVIAGHRPPVNTAGVGEIRVYALPSGDLIKSLTRQPCDYAKSAFFRAGSHLLSIDEVAGVVRVDDIASGKEVEQKTLPFARMELPIMAVSPDGSSLAICAGVRPRQLHTPWDDLKLYLWKWRDEKPRPIAKLEGWPLPLRKIGFSPDGRLLAGVTQEGEVRVWEAPGGRLLYEQRPSVKGSAYVANGMTFTPDGKTLAIPVEAESEEGRIEFLEPRTGRLQKTIVTGYLGFKNGAHLLTFSSDVQTLAVATDLGLRFWDLRSGKEFVEAEEGHYSEPCHILAPSNRTLVTASADGTVRAWDAVTCKQTKKMVLGSWAQAVAVSPDSKLLAASGFGKACIWEVATGREVRRFDGDPKMKDARALCFNPDGTGLLSWIWCHWIRLWDTNTGKIRFEHRISEDGDVTFIWPAGAAAFTSDGRTLFLHGSDGFYFFEASTGREVRIPFDKNVEFRLAAISPDSRYVLLGASDTGAGYKPAAYVIDVWSRTITQHLTLPGNYEKAVAFSADNRMFAVATAANKDDGDESTISIYETASGSLRASIRGIRGRTCSLAFLPDGCRLASGQYDSTVLIWDLTLPAFQPAGTKPATP